MAVLVFLLSLVLLAAGLASGYTSLDLLPTVMGLVYACAGVVSIVAAIIVFALGVVAVRLGRLSRAVREQTAALASISALAPALDEAAVGIRDGARGRDPQAETRGTARGGGRNGRARTLGRGRAGVRSRRADPGRPRRTRSTRGMEAPAGSEAPEPLDEFEEPLNENRAGRLPTFGAIERAIETPEAPPTLIGRYTSGGANYMIFSDGSIEAETDEGAFKFASMGDFKKFLLDRGGDKG